MSKPARKIAVTAMAWITALGDDLDAVWRSLLAGETGMKPVPFTGRIRNLLAAPALESDSSNSPSQPSPAKRLVHMASRTVSRALADAGHKPNEPGLQLVLGTSLGSYLDDDASRQSLCGWAKAVARDLGMERPPIVVSTACSAGSDAILVGAELVRSGAAACCVCGGADVLTASKRMTHSALGTMSPTRLRAFDARHDGTLLGEGAGMLVLEPPDTRSDIKAFFRGAGSANDASGMTVADITGLSAVYAMKRSLADAQLPASAIGVINAHGSGTLMNDTTEFAAFKSLFVETRPAVFATKGNFGHSLGATGAIEAIALILALRNHQVPPIADLQEPLAGFPLPLAIARPMQVDAGIGLSLTLGFGGFDTSLIFEAPNRT